MKDTKVLNELRGLDSNQLKEQVVYMYRELVSLKLQMRSSHVKDYSRVGKLRRIIARIYTVLREKAV